MKGTCQFLEPDANYFEGTLARVLKITFEDGFSGVVLVTKGEEVVGERPTHNIWHYELSQDGTKITLRNFNHSSSVDFLDGKHHETITDWPLIQ